MEGRIGISGFWGIVKLGSRSRAYGSEGLLGRGNRGSAVGRKEEAKGRRVHSSLTGLKRHSKFPGQSVNSYVHVCVFEVGKKRDCLVFQSRSKICGLSDACSKADEKRLRLLKFKVTGGDG